MKAPGGDSSPPPTQEEGPGYSIPEPASWPAHSPSCSALGLWVTGTQAASREGVLDWNGAPQMEPPPRGRRSQADGASGLGPGQTHPGTEYSFAARAELGPQVRGRGGPPACN